MWHNTYNIGMRGNLLMCRCVENVKEKCLVACPTRRELGEVFNVEVRWR